MISPHLCTFKNKIEVLQADIHNKSGVIRTMRLAWHDGSTMEGTRDQICDLTAVVLALC